MKNFITIIIFSFFSSILIGQVLLETDFDNGNLPSNWYFDPVPPYSPANRGEWTVSSSSSSFNTDPPSATYNWNPASSSGFADYSEHYLYSEIINVSDPTYALVQFQIALDGYSTPPNHYNGMKVEYSSDGNSWFTVLEYQISNASGATVDILPRTDEFYVTMDNTLQIRWETYGTNSYHIDRWHIDNVKVTAIPSIDQNGSATISSNNLDDSQKAIPGDVVTLAFTVPTDLADGTEPFVLINSAEAIVTNISGRNFNAEYTVPDDASDGPISFSIDFTTASNIPGPTCRNTTDDTNVLIDVTGPVSPTVTVNTVVLGGNVFSGIWNSTNENVQVEVEVPSDTTVVAFNYETGQSVDMVGSNSLLNIPSNIIYNVTNEFTFETYIKVNSATDYQGFLDFGQYSGFTQKGFGAFLYGGGWRFFLKTTGLASGLSDIEHLQASAPIDTWVHFAITLENSTLKLYRNGILIGSKSDYTGNVDWGGFSDNLILGSFDSGSGTSYFDGKIDEVRFWNIARTENEIKAYKNVGLNGDETGLIGYWRLDELSGSVATDLSATNNPGALVNGASFVQDSYFLFQEDSLNTLSIIGSKFQILSKISGNPYELIGDKITITADDLAAQKMNLSATADQFQSLTGFGHNLSTEFSARLFDQSGNFADGNTSATTLNIDIIAGPPSTISISSNNTYTHLAKTGDQITLNMSFDEDVNLPEVLIEGNSSTESDLGSESFNSIYVLSGAEPEGNIEFDLTVIDYLGNQNSYNSITDGSNVYYDKTKPNLDIVRIVSNNPYDTTWASNGNTISLYFTSNEDISNTDSIPSATILGQNSLTTNIGSDNWKAAYITTNTDQEGEVDFEITFHDLAGNKGDIVSSSTVDNNSKVIYDRTTPSDFTLGTITSMGGNIIDNVWNSTNNNLEVIVPIENDTTLKQGWVQIRAKIGSNSMEDFGAISEIEEEDISGQKSLIFSALEVEGITGFNDNDTIVFNAILYDRPGNQKVGDESLNRFEIDQISPSINYVSYKSNFTDTTLATIGDEITLSLKTNEDIQQPSVTISGNNANVTGSGTLWEASYIMQESDPDGLIPFEISIINDVKGNPSSDVTVTTTNSSAVVFDKTKPTLDFIRIFSDNSDTTWAKIGDSVFIQFKSNELLTQSSALISSASAEVISLGSQKYLAKYEMQSIDQEGDISFEVSFIDSVGIAGDLVTETSNSSNVIFDKTIPLLEYVHIESNNLNNSLIAITGDDVYLTFRPLSTDPILLDSIAVTISGQDATVNQNGDTYSATIPITESIPGGFITYTIDFVDRAGNRGNQVNVTTDDSYVNHDIVPPSIDSVSIYSNNLFTDWAKVGDLVFIEFFANEQLGSMNISILGLGVDASDIEFNGLTENNLAWYVGKREMNDADEEGLITFNIDYQDLGGVIGPSASQTTNNSYVKFDKNLPVINNIRVSSNNEISETLAAIGDVDSIFFTLSESYRELQVFIQGSPVNPVNTGILSFYAIKEMTQDDLNGLITFEIVANDSAGNSSGSITQTNDASTVLFDGTIPTLQMVSFYSSNEINEELAIVGDILNLDFISSEYLSSNSILIAGFPADDVSEIENNTYRAWRTLDGSETQGFIPFNIQFSDTVGNAGIEVNSTTDNSSILFDMTPPSIIELDTAYVSGGNVVKDYWNLSNQSIFLEILVTGDSTLFDGKIQPLIQFDLGGYDYIGNEQTINLNDSVKVLELSRSLIIQMSEYGEGKNISFKYLIWDKAGNQSECLTDNTIFHIDEIIPTTELDTLYSNNELSADWATVSDSIFISFSSNEGLYNPITILLSDTLINNDSQGGKFWLANNVVEERDPNGEINFYFSFSDTAGNFSEVVIDNSLSSVAIDKSNPIITNLLVGENNQNLSYFNKSDSLTLYWEHNDSLSGIKEVYFGLGSENNSTDIVNWTSSVGNNIAGLGSLNLINESVYYGGVFVRDSAGNYSDTIWNSGITIDTQIPDTGLINDGNWIIDLDYTLDSTKLLYTYNGFSDNIDILHYEIAVGTNNDTTNILDWVITDSTGQTTLFGFDLDRDTLYYSYIRGVDLALNRSETVRTDGIYFDDSEPKVQELSPNFIDSLKVLSVLRGDTIEIKFNRLIYFYDIDIKLNNETNFDVQEVFTDSAITLIWDEPLASDDTVIVYLDSALAYNTLFFSDTLYFHSQLWGDLNNDHDLTLEDILIFNNNWPNIDLSPFENNPPHVKPKPDGNSDLSDLVAFAKMWQWKYFSLSFDSSEYSSRLVIDHEVEARGNKVIFKVPQNSKMAEFLVGESNINILEMKMKKPNPGSFLFQSTDTLNQITQFSIADKNGLDSLLIITIPDTELDVLSCKVQYKYLDNEGYELDRGMLNLNVDILPDKFFVTDNYPNPFNSTTVIKYEIPDILDVNIQIYDVLGRNIYNSKKEKLNPGRYQFTWEGINELGLKVSTGIYFLQIQAGKNLHSQKLLLLK